VAKEPGASYDPIEHRKSCLRLLDLLRDRVEEIYRIGSSGPQHDEDDDLLSQACCALVAAMLVATQREEEPPGGRRE
jgi:hypothetical protein